MDLKGGIGGIFRVVGHHDVCVAIGGDFNQAHRLGLIQSLLDKTQISVDEKVVLRTCLFKYS